ncbi:hypothetical protein L596_000719 [Steinernema carpocapsae]|uniref:Uncharacterized protein n=1 Tax=Steinernema carpocapsae TaxID=34508 RepID=A0A4U8UN54_STECR|nr:hypothetical protein L596_000719 [Steinernema carpocapsae]
MSDETGLELSRRLQALTLVVPVRKIRPQSARRRQHRASLDEGIVTLKTAIDLQHRRANSKRICSFGTRDSHARHRKSSRREPEIMNHLASKTPSPFLITFDVQHSLSCLNARWVWGQS